MDLILDANADEIAAAKRYLVDASEPRENRNPTPSRRANHAMETMMPVRRTKRSVIAALAASLAIASIVVMPAGAERSASQTDGVVRLKSGYSVEETIARIKADIAGKGILFFMAVDQAKLAADAGLKLNASTLLIFGNPPLGAQFIAANPNAGLDWPVRLLVTQDESGAVWMVYTDFHWIARRHGITNRDPQFKMAAEVIASITSSAAAK